MGFLNLEEIADELEHLKTDIENSFQIYQLMRKYNVEVTEASKDEFMGKKLFSFSMNTILIDGPCI